ncbi:MAG: Hpt domain-containing protein [Bacteroidales bacterium]|nr:Hpt domain-containing protein [Bacteroidales bacterium]
MASDKMYDLEYLNEISGGDMEFINDMVNTFVEMTPVTIAEIKRLADEGKWKELYSVVHRFAPSLQFLGALDMESLVNKVEKDAMNQENTEEIPNHIIKIELFCKRVIDNLKEDFNL